MPLAVQALLPLAVLLAAALAVRMRPRQRHNGWIATGSTALAALIGLIELVRLAPGERVDVPYLTTFPYADLLIRLDGLSLAFATITLVTASLLMLVRQQDRRDRRDPWSGWLLTSAAVCALILAGNLLLVYVFLQVVTLAWSGALDERAPRRLRLRLTLQIADVGLLLAAASAIQSVGTSSFSGVPSDTFGVAAFWLMLLPVVVRLDALLVHARRSHQQPAVVEPGAKTAAGAGDPALVVEEAQHLAEQLALFQLAALPGQGLEHVSHYAAPHPAPRPSRGRENVRQEISAGRGAAPGRWRVQSTAQMVA